MPQIVHLARTEPEDRAPLYDDVRLLLSPGFLSETVVVAGHRFCLRTFSSEDFFLLRHRVGPDSPDFESKAWLIAMSIWMVDGQIIHEDQEALLRVHEMCLKMTTSVRDTLYHVILQLTRRVQVAAQRIEAYLYEVESRYLWRSEGMRHLERTPVRVGLNQVQRLWAFYNTVEDKREENLFAWAQTKFIAGTQAPKGIQKLNAKDQKAEEELEQKRQRIRDRMFYLAHKVPFPDEESRKFYNVNPLQTEEDLKGEMARWIRGEKDWHDRIIDYVKQKIRRSVEERRAEEARKAQELQQIVQEENPKTLQVLSPQMAEELRQRSRAPKRVLQDFTHNSAYDKYLAQDPIAGDMEVDPSTGLPRPKRPMDETDLQRLKQQLEEGPEDLNQYLDTHPPRVED